MNKKAIAILGVIFLLIVGTLGFLVYQKYSTNKTTGASPVSTSTPVTQGASPSASTTPVTVPAGSLVKLSDAAVVSPTLFFNGTGITYFTPNGDLYQADLVSSGNSWQLSRQRNLNIKEKSGITKIYWPAAGNNFIAELGSSGKPLWSFFNSQTGDYTDYPSQIVSFDWMPTGDKIIYVWTQNGKSTLNISDPDTKNWKKIADMWELDDSVHVSPDGSSIVYYETSVLGSASTSNVSVASSTNSINMVTVDGKVWKTLVASGYNSGVLWSPDSQKFLFGKKDPASGNFQLWYYNILTGDVKKLELFTVPSKAVWDKDSTTVYAAVSASANSGSGDRLFRLNTSTLEQKQLSGLTQSVNAGNLFLNQDGTGLFFQNTQDGFLYYLNISQ
jgi:Tol biopolymer transport system component